MLVVDRCPEKVVDRKSYLFYLSEDSAHGRHRSNLRKRAIGLIKALTALEAVLMGMIGGPLLRGDIPEVDFTCFGPAVSYENVELKSSF
eukprot:147713-Chlamydomonas_euryale.AAC.1